jgi:hypothetical protein
VSEILLSGPSSIGNDRFRKRGWKEKWEMKVKNRFGKRARY